MSGSRSKEQQQEWQQQKLQQEQQPGQQLAHLAARLGCVAAAALFVLAESVPGLECPWSSRASAAEAEYERFNRPSRRANARRDNRRLPGGWHTLFTLYLTRDTERTLHQVAAADRCRI